MERARHDLGLELRRRQEGRRADAKAEENSTRSVDFAPSVRETWRLHLLKVVTLLYSSARRPSVDVCVMSHRRCVSAFGDMA